LLTYGVAVIWTGCEPSAKSGLANLIGLHPSQNNNPR
jgi:hypothetical protein